MTKSGRSFLSNPALISGAISRLRSARSNARPFVAPQPAKNVSNSTMAYRMKASPILKCVGVAISFRAASMAGISASKFRCKSKIGNFRFSVRLPTTSSSSPHDLPPPRKLKLRGGPMSPSGDVGPTFPKSCSSKLVSWRACERTSSTKRVFSSFVRRSASYEARWGLDGNLQQVVPKT